MLIKPTELYIDWKANCRGIIERSEAYTLAQSIKAEGLHQYPLVSTKLPTDTFDEPYILVAGYTRTYACFKILGWEEMPVIVKTMTVQERAIANLQENLNRTNLNILQEAQALANFLRIGITRKEIAKRINKSSGWIQPRINLLQLDPEIQDMARANLLTEQQIRQLYAMKERSDRLAMAKIIKDKRMKGYTGAIEIKTPDTKESRRRKAKVGRVRSKEEIENLLLHLFDVGSPAGLHTLCLGWAAGNLSDIEIMTEIQTFLSEQGIFYVVSDTGIPNMNKPIYEIQ